MDRTAALKRVMVAKHKCTSVLDKLLGKTKVVELCCL